MSYDNHPPAPGASLPEILAQVVRDRLARTRRTQRDLARDVRLSEKHLSGVLNGSATASMATWDMLLHATAPPDHPPLWFGHQPRAVSSESLDAAWNRAVSNSIAGQGDIPRLLLAYLGIRVLPPAA